MADNAAAGFNQGNDDRNKEIGQRGADAIYGTGMGSFFGPKDQLASNIENKLGGQTYRDPGAADFGRRDCRARAAQ